MTLRITLFKIIMFIRISLYLIASILLGCAGDLDDQITKQDFAKMEPLNPMNRFGSLKVEDEVDEPISAKASEVQKFEISSSNQPEVLLNRRLSLTRG